MSGVETRMCRVYLSRLWCAPRPTGGPAAAAILSKMRSTVRLIAGALIAVFLGTPVWVAACDINCEAASRLESLATKSTQSTTDSTVTAHHQHHEHHAVPATEAAAATNRSSARIGAIADACDSAGLVVTASTAPSADRVWQAHLAPAAVSIVVLSRAATPTPSEARRARPRPDRPLAAVLRI